MRLSTFCGLHRDTEQEFLAHVYHNVIIVLQLFCQSISREFPGLPYIHSNLIHCVVGVVGRARGLPPANTEALYPLQLAQRFFYNLNHSM
jgi:hypothetical protein